MSVWGLDLAAAQLSLQVLLDEIWVRRAPQSVPPEDLPMALLPHPRYNVQLWLAVQWLVVLFFSKR